jgi:glycosyltransferase involved in cell wall biosynthesis
MGSPKVNAISDETAATPVTVTAIVPARNEEKSIAASVQALEQQPEIVQIVVVNDQSTDGTEEILRALAAEIPHLKVLEAHDPPPAG